MIKRFSGRVAVALSVMTIVLYSMCTSCILAFWDNDSDKKEDSDSTVVKTFVDQMMKQYYYWASEMTSSNTKKGKSVEKYFTDYLVSKDRWSWMMNGQTYNSMETGVSTSYGFHLGQPIEYFNDYGIFISYVDKNSPLAKAGITRGWQLTHIGGTDAATLVKNNTFYTELGKASNNFTFKTPEGESVSLDLTQASFQSNSVSLSKTFTSADLPALKSSDKVGYILYTTFNSNMKNEITSTLQQMKTAGITDLILDLRYNGGGDLSVCTELAGLLSPATADGKVFITLTHNTANQKNDSDYKIKRSSGSLNLDRLFVITGKGTASASESIINGLSPYMEINTVGGVTYGKPNGMYVFLYPQNVSESKAEYAFLPICFYCMNSQGKADYDQGITPAQKRYDDLYHDFSADEDLINACLTYIGTGTYPALPVVKSTKAMPWKPLSEISFEDGFKGAYIKRMSVLE